MNKTELLNKVLKATKVTDINKIIKSLKGYIKWIPVGGKDNNSGIINMGSSPAAAIIERVTNGMDAVIERKWIELGKPKDVNSPREASEKWFGIKGGYLRSIGSSAEMRKSEIIKNYAHLLKITMEDSDVSKRPTVCIRDKGIGIQAKDFADTILSLNGSRKLSKLFLSGAYGQGGSTAISFSEYTVIVSRTKKNDSLSHVAFTIVRYNYGDAEIEKHGTYEYCVTKAEGIPIEIDAPDNKFEQGTMVRHIAMDMGRYSGNITNPTGSLWYLTQHFLFNPVLPFQIEEKRSDKKSDLRNMTGFNRLIHENENTVYKNDVEYTFRNGKIKVYWWVLINEGGKGNSIEPYTLPSKPVIITFNGQKQGEFYNTIIKKELNLPYIDKHMVVEIECDRLDNISKRSLFSSTREKLRDGDIHEELKKVIVEILSIDSKLKDLNEKIKKKFLTSNVDDITRNVRKRLSSRVGNFIAAFDEGTIGGDTKNSKTYEEKKDYEIIPVKNPPTFLKIVSESPKEVMEGSNFNIKFETDADPSYFVSFDSYNISPYPPEKAQFSGATKVVDGHGIAYFSLDEETKVGESFTVNISVNFFDERGQLKFLKDSTEVYVVEKKERKKEDRTKGNLPNINTIFVDSTHDYWIENGWNQNTVSDVRFGQDSVEIYVSVENKNLDRLIKRAQQYDENAVDNVKHFYLEHISFHSFTTKYSLENHDDLAIDTDRIYEKELSRMSETLIGIMEQTFDVIIKG